jgi:hypothetical protein
LIEKIQNNTTKLNKTTDVRNRCFVSDNLPKPKSRAIKAALGKKEENSWLILEPAGASQTHTQSMYTQTHTLTQYRFFYRK